ncbi:MAG TPA: hypothetical protein VL625_09460, partial [Patescibacteria group bacterium]|nr:hypothetical protein [Patescibacteria group bacterium]
MADPDNNNAATQDKGWGGRQLDKLRNFSERQLYKAAKGAVRIAANIYGVRASGLDQFKNIKGPYVITPNH